MAYKIVRFYEKRSKRTIERGLTLDQAQAHCRNPETSARTCTSAKGKARTRRYGFWFDGYEETK